MRRIVLVGQGGHSKVITDIIAANENIQVVGYLDDKYKELIEEGGIWYGPISSKDHLFTYFPAIHFIVAIGNNVVRKRVVEKLCLPEQFFCTVIHPSAIISSGANIGVGSVIMANVVVNPDTQIGNHAIINTGAVVEHDNVVCNYAHISPNATLTGAVVIKEGVHIGASATIIPNVTVGEWSVVGAGATVIHSVPANCTVVGTPAKITKREGEKLEI